MRHKGTHKGAATGGRSVLRYGTYLHAADLPPKPDPNTGLPKPPQAPWNHDSSANDSQATNEGRASAPLPPPGQSPTLAWHSTSRKHAAVVGMYGALIPLILIALGTFINGFTAGNWLAWVAIPWIWAFPIASGLIIGLTQRKAVQICAGADWLASGRAWIRTYELVKVTGRPHVTGWEVSMEDRYGHDFSTDLNKLRQDPFIWDLTYNGILHSVVSDHAKTNGFIHRELKVPYPKEDDGRGPAVTDRSATLSAKFPDSSVEEQRPATKRQQRMKDGRNAIKREPPQQ